MVEHFKFDKSIYLLAGGEEMDLHNNYDFVGLDYSVEERLLILRWIKSNGDWVPETSPMAIELKYRNVHRFEFRPRDPEMPFTEDDCLADAAYFCDAGWPKSAWSGWEDTGLFTSDAEPEDDWLRAFQFQSGSVIVVLADEAHATIKKANNTP